MRQKERSREKVDRQEDSFPISGDLRRERKTLELEEELRQRDFGSQEIE